MPVHTRTCMKHEFEKHYPFRVHVHTHMNTVELEILVGITFGDFVQKMEQLKKKKKIFGKFKFCRLDACIT